jgi:hypothetical protein
MTFLAVTYHNVKAMDLKAQTARRRTGKRNRDKDTGLPDTKQPFVKETNASEEQVPSPQTAVTHQKASPQAISLAEAPVIMDGSTVTTAATATAAALFKVRSGYDGGFLEYSKVTTISELLSENDADIDEDFTTEFSDSDSVEPKFLHAVLLKIAPPSSSTSDSNQYVPFKSGSRFAKKPKTAPSGFKKSLLFGDLEDRKAQTFVILEPNNDTHNLLFRNKAMDDVVVGSRFAIKSPELVGKLKSGSFVVKTHRPLEVIAQPAITKRALDTSQVSESLRYFVLTEKQIGVRRNGVVTPMQTLCNGRACDRLQAARNPTAPCGCWGQSGRTDTLAKNTVLKLTFRFKDSAEQYVEVPEFTSLKWSKLLFHNGQILAECNELLNDRVFKELQQSFRKVLTHVNKNGGWTIVGWFKRAAQEEEDKLDNESNLLRETVRINISHLVPTKPEGIKIPDEHKLKQTRIRRLLDST